jgi:hypothetical protein
MIIMLIFNTFFIALFLLNFMHVFSLFLLLSVVFAMFKLLIVALYHVIYQLVRLCCRHFALIYVLWSIFVVVVVSAVLLSSFCCIWCISIVHLYKEQWTLVYWVFLIIIDIIYMLIAVVIIVYFEQQLRHCFDLLFIFRCHCCLSTAIEAEIERFETFYVDNIIINIIRKQ